MNLRSRWCSCVDAECSQLCWIWTFLHVFEESYRKVCSKLMVLGLWREMLSDLEDEVASHCHLHWGFLVAFSPRTAGVLKHSGHIITWLFVQNHRTNGSAATGRRLVTLIQGQNLVIIARDKHRVFTGMKCPCSDWDLITCLAENGEILLFLWRGLY